MGVAEEDVEVVILDGAETAVLELDFDELELELLGFEVERDDKYLKDIDEIFVDREKLGFKEGELEKFELVKDGFVVDGRVELTDLEVNVETFEVD